MSDSESVQNQNMKTINNPENNNKKNNVYDFFENIINPISFVIFVIAIIFVLHKHNVEKNAEIFVSANVQILNYSIDDNVSDLIENKKVKVAVKMIFTNDTKYAVTISDIIGEEVNQTDDDSFFIKNKYRLKFYNREGASSDNSRSIITIAPGQAYDGIIYYVVGLRDDDIKKVLQHDTDREEVIYQIINEKLLDKFSDPHITYNGKEYNSLFRIRYKYHNTINPEEKEKYYTVGFSYPMKMGKYVTREGINSCFVTECFEDELRMSTDETLDNWDKRIYTLSELSVEDKDSVINLIEEKYGYNIETTEELDKIAYYVANVREESVYTDVCEEFTGHQITCIAQAEGDTLEEAVDSLTVYSKQGEREKQFGSFTESSYWGVAVVPDPYNEVGYSIAIISSEEE